MDILSSSRAFALTVIGALAFPGIALAQQSAWARIDVEGEVPPPRSRACIGYDVSRDRIVLVGGQGTASNSEVDVEFETYRDDSWEWDGEQWEEVTPPGGNPAKCLDESMTYDPCLEQLVMFGVQVRDDGTVANATFGWDGAQWREIAPQGQPPQPSHLRLIGHAVAFDEQRGQPVLYGGWRPADNNEEASAIPEGFPDGVRNDTWVLSMAAEETSIESEGCGCSVEHRRIPTRLMCVLIALGAIVSRRFI